MTKTYYIMLHWSNGSAVDGFLVPNSTDEKHAITMLKKTLLCRMHLLQGKPKDTDQDNKITRIKSILKSLKRPWRLHHRCIPGRTPSHPTVKVRELILPTTAGFWLEETIHGVTICNLP